MNGEIHEKRIPVISLIFLFLKLTLLSFAIRSLATFVNSTVDASCLYHDLCTSGVCPRCSITHYNYALFMSSNWNTVVMCLRIFADVIRFGFSNFASKAISWITSQPHILFFEFLVTHGNKYMLVFNTPTSSRCFTR